MRNPVNRPRRWRRLLRELLGYALIMVVISLLANAWLTRNQASGQPPVIAGPIVEPGGGRSVGRLDLSAFDKPMLLYFFAEWCPVCKLQNPVIERISRDYPVVGIAMQSGNAEELQRYLAARGLSIPVVNDPSARISRAYGVDAVPAAFVIGADGEIRFSTRGYATEAGLRARLWLARAHPDKVAK